MGTGSMTCNARTSTSWGRASAIRSCTAASEHLESSIANRIFIGASHKFSPCAIYYMLYTAAVFAPARAKQFPVMVLTDGDHPKKQYDLRTTEGNGAVARASL